MGKKKKRRPRRKPDKPLLAFTGVLHLQKSFVPPTEESGLLNTVGGNFEAHNFGALVLAPNYGYGIPASVVAQLVHDKELEALEQPQPNVIEVNGVPTVTTDKNVIELNEDFPMTDDKLKESNPESLTIAELVRSIGGAKDKPFMRSDVVEDTGPRPHEVAEKTEEKQQLIEMNDDRVEEVFVEEEEVNHPEEEEFYESLGIARPKPPDTVISSSLNNNNSQEGQDMMMMNPDNNFVLQPFIPPQMDQAQQFSNSNESAVQDIQAYYKDYCKTSATEQIMNLEKEASLKQVWSWTPDPFSGLEQPIEFGHNIVPDSHKDEDGSNNKSIIELAKMAQRARRVMEAAISNKQMHGPHLPTDEEAASLYYDPLPMEIVPSETENLNLTKDTTMEQYWEYVKESPRDFNRWCYLIQHTENAKNITECRKAYGAFLPLFPYCFGYWKRYCELEKGHLYFHRALAILQRGLEFNPLSVDLWLTYLKLFAEIHAHQKDFQNLMRDQYERALDCAGMEFRSDALWDAYIDWEFNNQILRNVFSLYRRLLRVPTRLYNRHWDNFKALVRDHHPRDFLFKGEYEQLRKKGCKILKFKYKEEPDIEPGEIVKTSKPEDKLMAHVKEKIILKLDKTRHTAAAEADKRWDFEDKIKRPYFHTKPLDKGQLRNWENYLNFEISEGNHDRIVLLFERCLISCAKYEQFWCKYARYLEKYHRKDCNAERNISVHFQKSVLNFDLTTTTQTKEIAEEEATVNAVTLLLNSLVDQIVKEEEEEQQAIQQVMETLLNKVCANSDSNSDEDRNNNNNSDDNVVVVDSVNKIVINNVEKVVLNNVSITGEAAHDGSVALSGHSQLPPNSVEQKTKNDNDESVSSFSSLLSVPVFPLGQFKWHEAVRDVYKRACIVHCPDKPTIRLQWAAFEEEIENTQGARELIEQIIGWYPDLLDARSHLIELERRSGNHEQVLHLFETYLKTVRNCNEYSSLAIKYSRFLNKELGKPDKALAILRKAIKKNKGNHLLYNSVFDICHERFPSDRKGAAAALELALHSKDIKNEHKLQFIKKKILFLQEHGELRKYRDAIDQLYELQDVVYKEKSTEEALSRRENFNNQTCHPPMQPNFPKSVWEQMMITQNYVPIDFESIEDETQEAKRLRRSVDDQSAIIVYKKVPPTAELCSDNSAYGYGFHPDSKLQDGLSHQEYDKLVAQGYPEQLKDKEPGVIVVGNKGRKRKSDVPMFIIPPKGSYLINYLLKPKQC